MDDGGLFAYAAGFTVLFTIVVVLNNYKGVADIITSIGNLYGAAVGSKPNPLPY